MKTLFQSLAVRTLAFTVAALTGSMVMSARAQNNPVHTQGDLLVYFLKNGGTETVLARIALSVAGYTTSAPMFRDAPSNSLDIINLSAQLSGSFGANWYEDPALFWGVVAVRSSSTNLTSQVDGDPNRTLYVSQARTGVGTDGVAKSDGWSGFGNGDMTTGAGGIIAVANLLETTSTTDRIVTLAPNAVTAQNPFLGSSPGLAFGIFPGGVVGAFGAGAFGTVGGVNAEGAVDLYRILASTSASGQVAGPLREGTYEGTLVVDQGGQVSFIAVPEPASAALLGAGLITGIALRRNRGRRL